MATPKVTRTLFDQNLDRSVPQGPQNRSVVILGTGTDGPMYIPTPVASPSEASDLFGIFGNGTLTRGIKECFEGQAGSVAAPNVYGMRIGGVKADRAELLLYGCADSTYTTKATCEAASEYWDLVIKVESLYEGSVYNGVYLQSQVDLDGTYIYVWNPKSQLFSKFKIAGAESDDDVLLLPELVSSMNADPNVNSMLYTDEIPYSADLELLLNDTSGGEYSTSGGNKVSISLSVADIAANGATAWGKHSPIKEISSLYSISSSAQQTMAAGAGQYLTSEFNIADGFGSGTYPTIMNSTNIETAAEEAFFTISSADLADASGGSTNVTLTSGATTTMVLNNGLSVPIGDGLVGTSASGTIVAESIVITNVDTGATFTYNTAGGNAQDLTLGGNNESPIVTWGGGFVHNTLETQGAAEDWVLGNTLTVSVSFDTSTVKTAMTQVAAGSLPAAKVNEYRLNGSILEFGATSPYAMNFSLARLKYYEEGSTFFVNSIDLGTIDIVDSYLVTNSTHLYIGVSYAYIHDMVSWGDAPNYLEGGANGTLMTNSELKSDLAIAYEHFVSDEFDIMCIVDLTIDAEMDSGGSTISAGFGTQLSSFLDGFNGEMIGVIGFEPLEGNGVGGRVLRQDIADRIDDLTVPNNSGAVGQRKAASILSDFHQPFMYAVDIEGIFSANGVRYTAIGTSAVAGLIAKIPTEEAIFRFTVPGMLGLRYRYTETDQVSGDRQLDVLANARISAGMLQDGGVKITESRSLASPGSDFENMMTVLILQESLEICRSVAKDFIGKVSSAPLIQAFQSQLDKQIGDALVPRVLRGFKAPITLTAGERVLGKITIPLTLSPQFEIRDVHYNVQLTAEDIV